MRRCWLLLGVALLSSCLQSGEVPCGDGRTCPKDYTCTPTGCASEDQLKACMGMPDGMECSSTAGTGACFDGACVVAFCGNGKVEPPEVCDDGNQMGGDGCNGSCSSDETCGNGIIELDEECDDADPMHCVQSMCVRVRCGNGVLDPGEVCDKGDDLPGNGCSFDCKSEETCGNAIIDYFAGEQCDDGNTRALDGCTSTCQVEPMGWTHLDSDVTAPKLVSATAAFDPVRGRLVVFSGEDNTGTVITDTAETWELEGSTWFHRFPPQSPTARSLSALAYDSKRHRMVMFGGWTGAVYDADTWEYDGLTWTLVPTGTVPLGRIHHRLAYDSARERIVMFGGYNGAYLDETWEYDGTNWFPISPATKPPPRGAHGMTYDAKRGRVVITGGSNSSVSGFSDVWTYDGTTWAQQTSLGAGPIGSNFVTLTFDPARGGCVYIGTTDVYLLTASGWTSIATSQSNRRFHVSAFDSRRQHVVTFGGVVAAAVSNEAAELVGSSLVTIASDRPDARMTAAAFDSGRGTLVMFGGQNASSELNDTWELDGNDWRKLTVTGQVPSPRLEHAMAYDAARGKIVLFGGDAAGTRSNGTWEYDGATKTWSSIPTATVPLGRAGHAMVYDSTRSKIVMYGGIGSDGSYPTETWEYNGTNWTQVTSAASPNPGGRRYPAMAFDSKRGRTLLFGGSGTAFVPTVFAYDGTSWTQLTTTNQPTSRSGTAMVYDSGRDRTILHGGAGPSNDTYELDGATWSRYSRTANQEVPPFAVLHAMAYDVTRGRTLLVGSYVNPQTGPILTYAYGPAPLAPAEACTAGLDGDGDSKIGCADDDCWRVCTPYCEPGAPAATCPSEPRCGDTTCDAVEGCRICPTDCGACPVQCGDGFCDSPETAASCPGDCG